MQLFINQIFFGNHQNSKNILKSSNKISYITNITYLTPNNKIYNFFSRKKHLIKVLGLSHPTLNLKNLTFETKIGHHRSVPPIE